MSRWVIHANASFEARHALTSYRGEPESSHTHPWKIAVQVGTETLNEEDYALDVWAGVLPLGLAPRTPVPDGRLSPGIEPPELVSSYRRAGRDVSA